MLNEKLAEDLKKYGIDPEETTAEIVKKLEDLQSEAFVKNRDEFQNICKVLSQMETIAEAEEKALKEQPVVDEFDYSTLKRVSDNNLSAAKGKSAERDNAYEYEKALAYLFGNGVEQDQQKAFGMLLKCAEAGYTKAMDDLGICYSLGEGVAKDEYKAFEWIEKAAKLGNVNSMYNLSYYYKEGKGVNQDLAEAFFWMSMAYNNGHLKARHSLGVWYYNGTGTEIDKDKAISIWLENAKVGIEESVEVLRQLGIIESENECIPVNLHLQYLHKGKEPKVSGLEIIPSQDIEKMKKEFIILHPAKDFAVRMKSGGYEGFDEEYVAGEAEVASHLSDLWGNEKETDVYTLLTRALEMISGLTL